jgi:hypothetical protein
MNLPPDLRDARARQAVMIRWLPRAAAAVAMFLAAAAMAAALLAEWAAGPR